MEYEREKESGGTCRKGTLHDRVRDEEVGCDTVNASEEGRKTINTMLVAPQTTKKQASEFLTFRFRDNSNNIT